MTFEEAKEKINELFIDPQVPGYSVGDFDPEFTGTFEDLEEIIESLEEEYSTTDKLSVEKLQEQLIPYSKEMVQKIRDEKMQLVTADEFVKLHKESLTAIRENDKLQEQLNTAKKALTEMRNAFGGATFIDSKNKLHSVSEYVSNVLAAIGGDDEQSN